jgi:hypothetical protein
MNTQVRRFGRVAISSAFFLSLTASPSLFATSALAQTAVVSANAPTNPHDAAVAAAAKGDYIGALVLAKQAAAAGQPLDADQIDFMTGKAAKQQERLDSEAQLKATQVAAQGTAQQIMARQQKDYAQRAAAAEAKKTAACQQQNMAAASFSSDYSAAANQVLGAGNIGGKAFSGSPQAPPPISADRPGGDCG